MTSSRWGGGEGRRLRRRHGRLRMHLMRVLHLVLGVVRLVGLLERRAWLVGLLTLPSAIGAVVLLLLELLVLLELLELLVLLVLVLLVLQHHHLLLHHLLLLHE